MTIGVLVLLLVCFDSTLATSAVKLSFESVKRCPTADASLLGQRLSSKLQCAAASSRLKSCNAFHFNRPTGQCFHGDACSTLAQWTDGDCDSYKYSDVLCGDCSDAAKPVFAELQMKLFYKFSRSGLVNEADPRQFCLTAHDVTIDAGGAHFNGNSGSYLSTETPGFWQYFRLGREYSAIVRVNHHFLSGNQFYHKYNHCGTGFGNTFSYFNGSIYDAVLDGSQNKALVYYSKQINPVDDTKRVVSVGFSYQSSNLLRFYVNDSMTEPYSVHKSNKFYYFDRSQFNCLNLGQSETNAYCLNGSMICYGFSAKALNLTEFNQLAGLCN